MSELRWVERLSQARWPDDAIVIADARLPEAILAQLPDPLRVDAGEPLKTLSSVGALAERVLERRATRPLTLVAAGGGSVGDAVGFLASTLWRGVALWHVPTTLLAMVDSAHGGKTAVNLGKAKNQLGTFYPAQVVVLARDILDHAPMTLRQEGLAELIKALWLDDADALTLLEADGGVAALASGQAPQRLFELLQRAVAAKLRVVARDPDETRGIRTILNLGHTLAHALELEYGLTHGLAVAWGLRACARVSAQQGGLSPAQAARLEAHVAPLLRPIPGLDLAADAPALDALIARDKKRVGGTLRSVLLRAPGAPLVTTEVTPSDWRLALADTSHDWLSRPLLIDGRRARGGALSLEASKSELNRALLIAHLRPGLTQLVGHSEADDVVALRHALDRMRASSDEARVRVGQGGTTLRFALAAAARRQGVTTILAHPRLMARPHDALLDALGALGARVEPLQDKTGFRVEGAPQAPARALSVRVDQSSQFASALAMLSARGDALTLTLSTDPSGGYDSDRVASPGYLSMTLAMLSEAGVNARWDGQHITLIPTAALHQPVTLTAHADESSAAVWRAAHALGVPLTLDNLAQTPRQADRAIVTILDALRDAGADETIELDLRQAPDLAPVLTATAALLPCGLRITNAAHLRAKESNRIDDMVSACAQVGVKVEALPDGLLVPRGVQTPTPHARWPTHEDHRLAMAALVLSLRAPLVVLEPQVVAKSYPSLWHHASALGWHVAPVIDSAGPSADR